MTTTMNTLHNLSTLQLVLRNTTNAGGTEVMIFCLDTTKTTHSFISRLGGREKGAERGGRRGERGERRGERRGKGGGREGERGRGKEEGKEKGEKNYKNSKYLQI